MTVHSESVEKLLGCTSSNKSENIFCCVLCNKSFSKFNALRKHKKSHSEEQFSCQKCGKKFDTFSALNKHKHCLPNDGKGSKKKDEKINDLTLFSCSKCDKKFPKIQNLKDHERIHKESKVCANCSDNEGNEKPFNCSECDSSKSKLNSNIKLMSWNICRGTVTHWEEIKDTIEREKADLIFLLETDTDKENLQSIQINEFKTVFGNPGQFDGKVKLMAFIRNNILH